jgi:leader peptidase (prepilin peptidase)/N-methyltransferase
MSDIAADHDPFDESLWGEYARMLLVGTAACSAAVWAVRLAIEPTAFVMVVANILVMGIAVGSRLAGLIRLAILSLAIIGIVALFAAKQDPTIWWSPLVMFSPVVTVGALLVLVFRDGLIAVRNRTQAVSPVRLVVVAAVVAGSLYMIVIPSVDACLEMFRERPQSFTVEELSPLEVLRIRSAKLAVFAIFAYAGACVGSFLNVVAASAPRGEPIALRSSACPKCGQPIARVDNLPIISYLRLRGRCRDCDAVIPIRYFTVELVGLGIFASLFLYELVTGAANVPGFRHYHYAGILWIILYTKWPVVGIYFFHCSLFSCVLMLALMEQDRLQPPRWMTIVLPALFAGGAVGLAVAYLARSIRLRRRQSSSSLAPAFVLLGISLGWQAVLTIAVFWLVVMKTLKLAGGRWVRPRWLTPTTLLLGIAMLHHPAWKWLAGKLSF